MMDQGANINFLMFSGGTNFGFTAGANNGINFLFLSNFLSKTETLKNLIVNLKR